METEVKAKEGRTCIIAIDGSEHADYALDWYVKFMHRKDDQVILVYAPEMHDIFQNTGFSTASVYQFDREVMHSLLETEQSRIRGKLTEFAEKLKHYKIGGRVKNVVCSKPGEGIVEASQTEHADIIIMGSRGLGQLRRTFMGSVSDYVVHHSQIPVLVCKHPGKHVEMSEEKKE